MEALRLNQRQEANVSLWHNATCPHVRSDDRFRGQERTRYVRFDLIRMVIPPATKLKADLHSEWARPNADDITASRVDAYESTDRNYAGLHSLPRMRNLQKGTYAAPVMG